MLSLKATAVSAGDAHTRKTWTGDYCSRTYLVPGCPQSNMEHSPVLCEVNLLTIEHGINLLFELCPVCQIDKQLHRKKRSTPLHHAFIFKSCVSLQSLCKVRWHQEHGTRH